MSCYRRAPLSDLSLDSRRQVEDPMAGGKRTQEQKTFLDDVYEFIYVYFIGILHWFKEFITKHAKLSPSDVAKQRTGHVAIVTGGSRGIGLEIVRQLLQHNMHVIMASSNAVNGNEVLQTLQKEFPQGKMEFCKLDLKSLKSIKEFADEIIQRTLPLHLLINNAGIMFVPYSLTEDGFESQLGVNYIGHFYLTYLLLPLLHRSGIPSQKSRIINVSSCGHIFGQIKIDDLNSSESYSPYVSYGQSKLAQIMHSQLLQRYLAKEKMNVTINAVHPGIVNTNLYDNTFFSFVPIITNNLFKSTKQGAEGIAYVALADSLEGVGGRYFTNCKATPSSKMSCDIQLQRRLWEETCSMLNIDNFPAPSS